MIYKDKDYYIKEIYRLVDTLNYHTKLYDAGTPEISDQEWDDMYFDLQALEGSFGLYLPNSPTQRVNYDFVSELKKVKHNHPMLSLDKTKDCHLSGITTYATDSDHSHKGITEMLQHFLSYQHCSPFLPIVHHSPLAFPSSQIASISARVISLRLRPLRIVCSSR